MTNWAAGMDITSARLSDATKADQLTFTPSFGNKGSATYTTQTGYYYTFGKLVYFTAYIAINAGGSGSTALTLQGPPLNIDRTARQVLAGLRETSSSSRSEGVVVSFTGGSGSVWDNLVFGGAILKGSDLAASCLHVFTGMYLSA